MPRKQKPLDPGDGPLAEFARDLRMLRDDAGNIPYRVLAKRAGFAASTLSVAASGTALPSLDVTLAYVQACGGDAERWTQRWHQLAADSSTAIAPSSQGAAKKADGPGPRTRTVSRRDSVRWAALAVLVLLAGGALAVALHPPGRPAAHPADGPTESASYPYDHLIGPGCPDAKDATTSEDNSGPAHQWGAATAENWAVASCADEIFYSQPTTERNPDRWQDDYFWIFSNVPAEYKCIFRIYIPDSPYSQYAATYDWSTSTSYLDQDAFVIDQAAYRGRWYRLGPLTFTAGKAVLILTDTRTSTPNGTLTAGAVRLTCASDLRTH